MRPDGGPVAQDGNTLVVSAKPRHYPPCAVTAISDIVDGMAVITIRQLEENIKSRLRVRAAHHGRSMEAEARAILRSALGAASPVKGNLAERIRQRFAPLGGVELKLPRRDPIRKPPDFTQDRLRK
jgi:plasmid stability protein